MSEPQKGFWAKCGNAACGHCWVVAFYPRHLGCFSEIVRANSKRCPKCGDTHALVAKQDGGKLLEEIAP